jgi:hypothetical protein
MLRETKMTRKNTVMIRGNMMKSRSRSRSRMTMPLTLKRTIMVLHHQATTCFQMAIPKNATKTTKKMRRRCRLPIRKFKKEFKLMMKIMIKLKQREP